MKIGGRLFHRRWLLRNRVFVLFLCCWQFPAFGEQFPISADQVIANYHQALGGPERLASIKTFTKKGESSGDLIVFGGRLGPASPNKEHLFFEFYYKAPNLRYSVMLRENNVISTVSGCDGAVSWYIGADAVRHEFKPKPGSAYECKNGFEPIPLFAAAPNLSYQLKGEKKVAGRMAWVIRAHNAKSDLTETYYFDSETYLLVRRETSGQQPFSMREFKVDTFYSDYRDVGGIKLPFMLTQRSENSSLVTILREVQINGPLDDARFQEPKILGGPKNPQVQLYNSSNKSETQAENVPVAEPTKIEPSASLPLAAEPPSPETTAVVTINFASASIAELQRMVPELHGITAAEDQRPLPELLDKVGNRIQDIYSKIPNLISDEDVSQSEVGGKAQRELFSYLMIAHRSLDAVTLDEFRVDLKTGAKLETTATFGAPGYSPSSTTLDDLARSSQQLNARATGSPLLSFGAASTWVRFYPSNRSESNFRYLGQQKVEGHPCLVLAFAQKPGSVRLPGEVRAENKAFPVYYQGIAWVDPGDFRILHLRNDLLSPVTELSLTQITSEIRFKDTQVAGFPSAVWLPREVFVTTRVKGHTFHEKHSYSHYRSFQAHSRILLGP
jgi:hypothetical protein